MCFAVLANSIDAGATSVEIKVDLPCYRFSVSDDGCGISADKLRDLVGTQRGENVGNKQFLLKYYKKLNAHRVGPEFVAFRWDDH